MFCARPLSASDVETNDPGPMVEGYERDGDKCFPLEEYKRIATGQIRYETCARQRDLLLGSLDSLELKTRLLQMQADDLSILVEDLDRDRRAMLIELEQVTDKASVEKQRAKIWRLLAAGSGVISVTLGIVVFAIAR